MAIEKIIIENFKMHKYCEMQFNDTLNIIVGNNEAGKTTILEAIYLAMTGYISGKNVFSEISPYWFNISVVKDYINKIKNKEVVAPPRILIELYLKENENTVSLLGTNNSKRENKPGITMSIEFDNAYSEEYSKYIECGDKISTIPVEYYKVCWYSFANNQITSRSIPINSILLDTSVQKNYSSTDKYILKVIDDILDTQKKVNLSLLYREMKEKFASEDIIKEINTNLTTLSSEFTDKTLTVSVDISSRTSWENTLTSYLDDVPFFYVGKGEESAIKLQLSLETNATDSNIILIEEPENHLSFSNMSILIDRINKKCQGKQIIMTTHSNFVLNKLGISNVILLTNSRAMTLNDLDESTKEYFEKLPGYDTLRMILSKKSILVEGPSDELIVQKAYIQKYGKLPIQAGVDVISVRGLAFKRFLEIAEIIGNKVYVVTDNDGDYAAVEKKYNDFFGKQNIYVSYSKDNNLVTLEDHIVSLNELSNLNKILNKNYNDEKDLLKYMKNNKTDWALDVFKSSENINIPEYIENVI